MRTYPHYQVSRSTVLMTTSPETFSSTAGTEFFFGFRPAQNWIWVVVIASLGSLTSICHGYDDPSPRFIPSLLLNGLCVVGINEPIHVGEKRGILLILTLILALILRRLFGPPLLQCCSTLSESDLLSSRSLFRLSEPMVYP